MSSDSQKSGSSLARNTALLYFRMLLMMCIGLFTSRVILRSLGEDDFGVYNAVGGVVIMFTMITNTISNAISRYITVALGKGDSSLLKRVFSTSVLIQIFFCAVVVLLTETLGIWYLENHMVIPADRMGAAHWVLQCSAGLLVANLLSVPFNSVIIAHERMSAYAYISILEAVLKLSVAAAIFIFGGDKLKIYAVLMFAVAVIVRATYASFCHRHFEETRGRLTPDRSLVREMSSFVGWNFLGSGSFLLNTQGLNLLTNSFFGVAVNAARGVATQVENIVKQFSTNLMTAFNPQITKSYAACDYEKSFSLVRTASKYTMLVLLLFAVPLSLEADTLLKLWLGADAVPQYTTDIVRLIVFGIIADMTPNAIQTMILATGRIKVYYILTSIVTLSCFPIVYVLFRNGYSPVSAYVVYIVIYILAMAVKLYVARSQTGFPVGEYCRKVLLPGIIVALASYAVTLIPYYIIDDTSGSGSFLRLLSVGFVGVLSVCGFSYFFALSREEKEFVKSYLRKFGR